MAVIENLSKENVKSVLNNLYVEAKREPDRLCSPAEERRRMASIRQQIKIVTLFLDECRYEEVEDQVRYVERLVKGQQRVAEEVKT